MKVKGQLKKLKENWLLILILLIVLALFMSWGKTSVSQLQRGVFESTSMGTADVSYATSAPYAGSRGYISPIQQQDFAPDILERKITKTANIANEIERGHFKEAESELKSIIEASKSFLLNENVNKIGKDRKAYYRGSYQIKTETGKYDVMISKLKKIGEVTSFNENSLDITGTFAKLEIELENEKERLERYKNLYQQATKVEDKLNLEDRIFNQERRVKYIEDSLRNAGQRVEYSTIHVALTEEQSQYSNVLFVKFSELVRKFVSSVNDVLKLVVWVIPYLIAIIIIWFIVRAFRKKKR